MSATAIDSFTNLFLKLSIVCGVIYVTDPAGFDISLSVLNFFTTTFNMKYINM
jgi:hypothetical protein